MKISTRSLVLLLIALVALCATMTCAIEHTNRVDDLIPNPSRITIATTPTPDHEKIKTVLGSATLNHYNILKRANATDDDKIKPDNKPDNNKYDYDDYVWSDDDVAFGLFLFGLFFILFPVLLIVAVQSKRRAKLQKEKEDNEAAARAALGHAGITITPAPDQTVAGAKRWVITIPDNFQQQPQPYALPTTFAQQQQPQQPQQQHAINVAPQQQPPQQYNPPQYVTAASNPYQYQQQP